MFLHIGSPHEHKTESHNVCLYKGFKELYISDTHIGDKEPPNMPLSSICVGHLLLEWGLPLRVVCFSSEIPLVKTIFFVCK